MEEKDIPLIPEEQRAVESVKRDRYRMVIIFSAVAVLILAIIAGVIVACNSADAAPEETIDISETTVIETTQETEETTTESTTAPETSEPTETTQATEPSNTYDEVEPTKPSVPATEETIHTETEETTPSEPSSEAPVAPERELYSIEPPINDRERLACVIYQEVGGSMHCDDCRRRVADVVLNRVADPRFPNSIEGVLLQSGQYGRLSWTGIIWAGRATNPNEQYAVERAYRIADEILAGQHSELYGNGYVWQAGFIQGKDNIYCCGHYFGR